MRINFKILIMIMTGVLLSRNVWAQAQTLTSDSSLNQSVNHEQGNYPAMNTFGSLGMFQEAWQDPMQNLGEGQIKPAYSKYYWSPDMVLPVRLREGMITLINFPEWEYIEQVFSGNQNAVKGQINQPNSVMLYPDNGANYIGVDTNVVVVGRSGNKYVFYVRNEGFNTERITNSIIDIDVVDHGDTSGGGPRGITPIAGRGSHVNASGYGPGSAKSVDATFTRRFLKEDWLKSIPMDAEKFRFDVEIYVPNPDDVIIAPERVWHDDIFTYIDLGEKAINMVQRPIVTMIIERSETPVGFRTKGPNNRLIIVEGVGDMVMRSGKRMVCLKMRRSDDEGMQYVTYADTSDEWDIAPAIPGKQNGSGAGASASGGSLGTGNGGTGGQYVTSPSGGVYVPNGANAVFSDGIDLSNMKQINATGGQAIPNPYPQYKYGTGFEGQTSDSISIELGTDSNVNNLEHLWKDLSGRYSSVLGNYEPFYSVDAPADGQGKELFHLRVGPVKSLDSGDSVCSQLGRNGVFCSVVRVQ